MQNFIYISPKPIDPMTVECHNCGARAGERCTENGLTFVFYRTGKPFIHAERK